MRSWFSGTASGWWCTKARSGPLGSSGNQTPCSSASEAALGMRSSRPKRDPVNTQIRWTSRRSGNGRDRVRQRTVELLVDPVEKPVHQVDAELLVEPGVVVGE